MDYQKILSQKVLNLKPSGIRRFFDIAAEMDDVISLGVGEPDFKTPWAIRQAGIDSLQRGHTWYTANAGLIQLRREIANYLQRRFELTYDPKNELLVTVGGSEAIDAAIRALVDNGDEVLIPEPSFVCYDPITRLTGGVPVALPTRAEDAFRLTPQQLKNAITPRTKLLILPFPNNPTGAVMRRQHLEEIAEVLRGTDILVLSDEIYAELTYGKERHISFATLPGMWERTITINGFSKAYAMTGWRLGYAAGPAPLLEQITKIHQFGIMSAPTMSQYAAIEAMRSCDEDIEEMREQYNMRRRLLVDELNALGLTCFEPEGAFYVFPSITKTNMTSMEFCERLLQEQHVAVIPGNAFGDSGEGYVRISYSYSTNHIIQAIQRLKKFTESLHL